MKILVTGHARHGKDTVCEIMRDLFGLTFCSSSKLALDLGVIEPYLAELGIYYSGSAAAFDDRAAHRAAWHDAIRAYNTPDPARLGRELFAQHNVYCGIRNREEFVAIKAAKLFDVSVWVDRSGRCPSEPYTSMQIRREDCDLLIDNNSTLVGLKLRTMAMLRDAKMLCGSKI